jgi:two-component system, LytTR family, sensor kinase
LALVPPRVQDCPRTMKSRDLRIVIAAWTMFGLAQFVLATLMTRTWEINYLLQFMPRVWLWACFTPLIAMWDLRVRKRIILHVPLFVAACLLQATLRRTTVLAMGNELTVPFYVTFLYFADVEAVRYVASLMLGRVLRASHELARKERRAAQLKNAVAHAQLHYLNLQLQPHFLFNALGSISELAHEAPAVAARMVDHLASLLRYATQPRLSQEVTLREELAALSPYLEIQRMRFPDWLSISERIEPAAEDAMIPRMLLQPLVENAIRHGLSNRKFGGLIVFGASVHGDDLVLSVHDNGAGLSPQSGTRGLGIGLSNIRERLATLYGDRQSLDLLSHDEGGVEVVLRIPLRRSLVQAADIDLGAETEDQPYVPDEPSHAWQLVRNWIVAGVLLTLLSLFYIAIRNPASPEPALDIIRRHVIHAALWIALTPIVLWLARRFPVSRQKAALTLALHVVTGTLVAISHVAVSRLLGGGELRPLFSGYFIDSIFWNLTAYGILLAVAQRSSIEGWIRERDVAAAQMQAELTSARLSSVMVELRPDFLLDALARLRHLVTLDPPKAEALLANLAEFLRLTMESLGRDKASDERRFDLHTAYAKVRRAV